MTAASDPGFLYERDAGAHLHRITITDGYMALAGYAPPGMAKHCLHVVVDALDAEHAERQAKSTRAIVAKNRAKYFMRRFGRRAPEGAAP